MYLLAAGNESPALEALERCLRVSTSDPERTLALCERGATLRQRGSYRAADEALEQARLVCPLYASGGARARAEVGLALLHLDQSRFREAAEILDRAEHLINAPGQPASVRAEAKAARARIASSKPETQAQALELCQDALRIAPLACEAHFAQIGAFVTLGRQADALAYARAQANNPRLTPRDRHRIATVAKRLADSR